jgi:putative transcriptional regulator
MNSKATNLSNHFLIAMPKLMDINFSQSVTYICEHDENGALGITINRPADVKLSELFNHLDIVSVDEKISQQTIFLGGPVQIDRGFLLHTPGGSWDSSLKVTDTLSVTTSRDILNAIALGQGPDEVIIALGYAGWAGGQLEAEISANAWLSCPANEEILFHTPAEQCWQKAAQLMGVDLTLLSHDAGHA